MARVHDYKMMMKLRSLTVGVRQHWLQAVALSTMDIAGDAHVYTVNFAVMSLLDRGGLCAPHCIFFVLGFDVRYDILVCFIVVPRPVTLINDGY